MPTTLLNQLTPVMVVDRVEPCIAFWVERFGFTSENEVPGPDGALMFASAGAARWRSCTRRRPASLPRRRRCRTSCAEHSITLFIG